MITKSILGMLLLGPLYLLVTRELSTITAASYCNSLTVDGRPLDYDTFSLSSHGVLALVEGDLRALKQKAMPYQVLLRHGGVAPQSASSHTDSSRSMPAAEVWPATWLRGEVGDQQSMKRKPVPFRVSLRRNGAVLRQWPTSQTEIVYSVNLDEIWTSARINDELIVEPVISSAMPQATENRGKRVIKLKKGDPTAREGC